MKDGELKVIYKTSEYNKEFDKTVKKMVEGLGYEMDGSALHLDSGERTIYFGREVDDEH